MPDQKLAAPYGDIVFVNTPNLDRMGAMIYNEEKQRKAAQAKADADLDNEFSKNIAGIHNADIPDLTKAWGDFKAARQSLIATKGGTTPEQQMAALQAKARVYDLISKSKLRKESDKFDVEDYKNNRIRYKKDAHERMLKNMNTPTSQLPKDYHNDYLYDGSQSDFSKALDFAKGKTIDMPTEEVPNANGLGKSLYSVKRLSNPSEYFHRVLTKVVGDQQTDDFSRKYFVEPDEYNKVKDQYDLLIADPKVKSRLGMQVDLPQESDLTPLTRAAKYLAMQHTIQNPPVVSLNKVVKDDKAIIDYKFANDMKKLGANDRYIRGRMRYKKELGLPDEVNETTGIVFDEIGGEKDVDTFTSDTKFGIPYAKKAGRISKGIVFDESGNVMADGEVSIKKEDLPANMIVVLNNQKMTVPPVVKVIVKNGEINGVNTNSGIVDRNGMMNFQKVYNKEPLKGSQLKFGKKSGNNKPFQNKKTFNVINPQTGQVIMSGVDEAAANKAKSKGYKIN